MNEFGDTGGWEFRVPLYCKNPCPSHLIQDACMETLAYIKDFKNECEKKGIILLLFPPAVAHTEAEANLSYINWVDSLLQENATPFCTPPNRYVYNDTLFFDTPYHMTKLGVQIRTQQLIQDVDSLLQ